MLTKEELAKQLGNNVRFWRTKRGLSQAELANAVGISKDHCVQVEAGNRGISLFVSYKISKVLKVTPDSLLVNNEAQQDIHIKNILVALNSIDSSQISKIDDIIFIMSEMLNNGSDSEDSE